ncbi:MAG: right-handed parallel beta-helix repeat-containing protein [Candidatus Marsarchaeota archaeon]|nr:right-handed parallel beta-helix repeat-containing protein [Candidatus Marsarchaeota archaeon]
MFKLRWFFGFIAFLFLISTSHALACGNVGSSGVLTASIAASGNCFNVTASNIIINCNGFSVVGNGSGDGFDVNNMSNVSIINCSVSNFTAGVNASEFNNLTIGYSNFTNNLFSINTWSPFYYVNGTYIKAGNYTPPSLNFVTSYGLNLFNNQFLDQYTFNNNPYSCNVIYNASIQNNTIKGAFAGYHLGNSTISYNNFSTGFGTLLGNNIFGDNLALWSYNNITNNYFKNANTQPNISIDFCGNNYFYNNNFTGTILNSQVWCGSSAQGCLSNGYWPYTQTNNDNSVGNNTFDYNNFTRNNTESPFYGLFVNYFNNVNYLFENITSNNWIDGKSVLYYSPYSNACPSNTQLNFGNNQYGFVGLVNCTNINVTGTFYTGLVAGFTSNSLFNNSNVTGTSKMGFNFFNSSNIVVQNCNVNGNGSGDGFDINDANNVSIINCSVSNFTNGVSASEFNNLTINQSTFVNNSNSIYTPHITSYFMMYDMTAILWLYNPTIEWHYMGDVDITSSGLNLFNNFFLDPTTFSNNEGFCNAIYNSTIENNTMKTFNGIHLGYSNFSFNNFSTTASVDFWDHNNIISNYFTGNTSIETSINIAMCSYNYFYNNTLIGGVFNGNAYCSHPEGTCAGAGGWFDYQTGNNTFDYNNITRINVASPFMSMMTYNYNYLFENITSNNWIDGKSVNYSSPWSDNICPSNTQLNFGNNQYGFVGLVNCTNITVTGTFYTGLGVGLTNNSLFNSCNVSNNVNVGLAFMYSNNNTIQNSNITNTGSNSLWFISSNFNNILNILLPSLTGQVISIVSASNNNYFQNIYLPPAGTGITIYGVSSNNTFNNLTEGGLTYGLGFYLGVNAYNKNAVNTTVENSVINTSGLRTPFRLYNSSLTVINTSLNASSSNLLNASSFYDSINSTVPYFNIVDSLSSVLIQWFLNTRVQDTGQNGVYNITVNVTNSSGLVLQNITDINGSTGWNVLSQEFLTNSSILTYAPYTASAIFNGCASRVYSTSTQLTSSQILSLTLQNLVRTLQLLSVSPSIYNIYKPNQNISLTFEIFNPSCLSTNFNITVYTPQGSFNCTSSTNGYASVYVPCGYLNLSSYINTVILSFSTDAGWSAQPSFQNFTFYTTISNNIVVPDSNVMVILVFAFISFFIFKNKLKK